MRRRVPEGLLMGQGKVDENNVLYSHNVLSTTVVCSESHCSSPLFIE
ncbi:MAG: hypothetical protein IPJ48_17450 [Propionivibrio sp.]|uniref:Uncharacterized protein n=1 Tax=Candidatus Propionivibrio dominans TaxID=2954373 RepID=A0A9D7FE59_9RHOO|nr:hypothetical protein [Candidatus Propionivibrio dominans]